MIRSMDCGQSCVCRVAKTRWPVSAAVRAIGHGLEVAHLADEDDVGVLAKRGPQGRGERLGVGSQLALVDHAALVHMQELYGVFDGDDVVRPGLVDLVDDGGQGGGLA